MSEPKPLRARIRDFVRHLSVKVGCERGPFVMSALRKRWVTLRHPHANIHFGEHTYLGPGFSLHSRLPSRQSHDARHHACQSGCALRAGQQGLEGPLAREGVVVEQPHPVVARGIGLLQPAAKAARSPDRSRAGAAPRCRPDRPASRVSRRCSRCPRRGSPPGFGSAPRDDRGSARAVPPGCR